MKTDKQLQESTRDEQQCAEIIPMQAPDVMDALEIIESRNKLFDRVMEVAIRSTSQGDWVDQAGKPYLQGSGAEKVARRFGVKLFDIVIDREDHDDDNGKYCIYTTTGKVSLGNSPYDVIESIGTCSSRDKFFGRANGRNKDLKDVDLTNIKKKSYTNFIVNAVTRLLGLRNLSWDDLSKYGISRDGKTKVTYMDKSAAAMGSSSYKKNEANAKNSFWVSEYNNQKYLWASADAFGYDFLAGLGFKPSKKDPNKMFVTHTASLEEALTKEVAS